MRPHIYSLVSAVVYILLGVVFALGAVGGQPLVLGSITVNGSIGWGLTGLMFVMAYFSIVHLKEK